MSFETLITFCLASFILSLAPGPDNIFVLTQSVLHGKKAGFIITLGLCTGLVFHTTAVALGLATIFMMSSIPFIALKVIGVFYLCFLSWQAFKSSNTPLTSAVSPSLNKIMLYRRGIFMNLSNPKIALFFLAFLPQFVDPNTDTVSSQLFILGLIFISIGMLVFFSIATLAGYLSSFLRKSNSAQMIINKIAALVFLGLAVRLATLTR